MSYSASFKNRIIDEADYMIQHKCTVRDVAAYAGLPKSTVHLDLTARLEKIDKVRARKVRKILDANFDDRQRRGGVATGENWKKDYEGMYKKVVANTKFKVTMEVQ